jgi:hypothetical protein
MNIYLLVLWLLPLAAAISAAVIVATDKRVRHDQGRSISKRGLIAVIGEQTNAWTFAELNDGATTLIEPASMYTGPRWPLLEALWKAESSSWGIPYIPY